MEIKFKIWIEKDGAVLFGKGREELLSAIEETQTLSAAAKRLCMSYRGAWGRIKASEERLGFKLLEKTPDSRGMRLTAEGKKLLNVFKQLRSETDVFMKGLSKRVQLNPK